MCERSGGECFTGKVCRQMSAEAISVCAVLIASVAGFLDWRSRRIPNWLTVPASAIGLGSNFFVSGVPGLVRSFEGAGAVMIVLLPVVLLRGLGGGDWKLMGALGACLGPTRIILVLLVTIFVAGFLALIQIIRRKRFIQSVCNMWELLRGFFVFGLQPHPEINLDSPTAMSLPFGVAAALATVGCFWARLTC
jgi:prepilin peptidase CpaA